LSIGAPRSHRTLHQKDFFIFITVALPVLTPVIHGCRHSTSNRKILYMPKNHFKAQSSEAGQWMKIARSAAGIADGSGVF
jgi:hypothetical protein